MRMMIATASEFIDLPTKTNWKIDNLALLVGLGIEVARLARSCAFAYLGDSLAYRRKDSHREETQPQLQFILSIMRRN